MSKFNNVNVLNYPSHILKSYSESAKNHLAEQAIKNKNYAELKYIAEHMDYVPSLTEDAINALDPEAARVIVDVIKNSKDEYNKDGDYVNAGLIEDLLNEDNMKQLDFEEPGHTKRSELLQIFLGAKDKDSLTLVNLQTLVNSISQLEFETFCDNQGLDLTSDKFKDLEIPYKIDGLTPALVLDRDEASIMDSLLSRTLLDKTITIEEIKTAYTDLYNLHPIAKEMLTLLSFLISKNNDVKIIFSKDTNSHYNPTHNIIRVNSDFKHDPIFNLKSVLIHEIAHYVYYQVFKSHASPFDKEPMKDILKDILKDYKEYIDDEFADATPATKIFKELIQGNGLGEKLKPIIAMLEKYEIAARKPIDKAAELLHMDSQEYSKYDFTNEYTEYFKHNSYIDLFYLNGVAGFRVERDKSSTNTLLKEKKASLEKSKEELNKFKTELIDLKEKLQINEAKLNDIRNDLKTEVLDNLSDQGAKIDSKYVEFLANDFILNPLESNLKGMDIFLSIDIQGAQFDVKKNQQQIELKEREIKLQESVIKAKELEVSTEKTNTGDDGTGIKDHVFDNVMRIYLESLEIDAAHPYKAKLDVCANLSKPEIMKWALEEFLPKLVSELNLSPEEVHYLDRVGDYVNRGHHNMAQYHSESSNKFLESKKYVELIVRAMEFRAAGLGENLVEPFAGLENFHLETVSEAIALLIGDYDLPFTE